MHSNMFVCPLMSLKGVDHEYQYVCLSVDVVKRALITNSNMCVCPLMSLKGVDHK